MSFGWGGFHEHGCACRLNRFYALTARRSVRQGTDTTRPRAHAAFSGQPGPDDLKDISMNTTTPSFAPSTVSTPALPVRTPAVRWLGLTAVTALALTLMACATRIPAPTQELALSRAAIDAAARAGAAELAPAELTLARQKQAMADTAMTQEQHDRARMLSHEVQVDARLAEAKARSRRADRAASELREDGRVLRQEINRTAPQ